MTEEEAIARAEELRRRYVRGQASDAEVNRFLDKLQKNTLIPFETYRRIVIDFTREREIMRSRRRGRPRPRIGAEGIPYIEHKGQLYAKGVKWVKCPNCGNEVNILATTICPTCGFDLSKRKFMLRERFGKRIKGRIYEAFISVIIGILCIFVPPIFALPPLMLLGITLMTVFPAYIIFPSGWDVRVEMERTGVKEVPGRYVGILFTKALLRITAFLLIALQFVLFTPNYLIALIITFFFYFTLPTRYKTNQPYKAVEAWLRMGVGAFLAWLFFMAFGPGTPVGNSLLFLGLAFFVTLPVHIEAEEEGGIKITIFTKGGKPIYGEFAHLEALIFVIFMLISLAFFLSGIGGISFSNMFHITFLAIWGLSFFTGLTAGPEGKPMMGALMIAISLFVFSGTFTDTMGQAVFGYWWPQVRSFGEMVFTPLSDYWSQAQRGMSEAWLLLTNPAEYYRIQMQKQQATKTVVKSGGTTKSIELTKFDLFPSIPGQLDPQEVLIGSIELENQGEYDANYIKLEVYASWRPPDEEEQIVGSLKKVTCSGTEPTDSSCIWDSVTYPQEIKLSTFVFDTSWVDELGNDLGTCKNENGDCSSCDASVCPNATYKWGGYSVYINANYTFDYSVNVSIPIEIINQSLYTKLLEAREITLQELTSQYTGGPVKATIWTQRQPYRNNEESLVVASVYNDGNGVIREISSFKIYVPKILGKPNIIGDTFGSCQDPVLKNESYEIICTYEKEIEPGEFKRISFLVRPNIGNEIDKKTTLVIGVVNYEYKKTSRQTLQVAPFPQTQ